MTIAGMVCECVHSMWYGTCVEAVGSFSFSPICYDVKLCVHYVQRLLIFLAVPFDLLNTFLLDFLDPLGLLYSLAVKQQALINHF